MKIINGPIIVLQPEENMHLKCNRCGDIYDYAVYLGKYDSPDNYCEVTEEEYQNWLAEQQTE